MRRLICALLFTYGIRQAFSWRGVDHIVLVCFFSTALERQYHAPMISSGTFQMSHKLKICIGALNPSAMSEIRTLITGLLLNKPCNEIMVFFVFAGRLCDKYHNLMRWLKYLDRVKRVCVFGFNVAFNNFSVISRRCLVATGSSMLTFIVLPHWSIVSQTLDMIPHPVTLSWHWVDQS